MIAEGSLILQTLVLVLMSPPLFHYIKCFTIKATAQLVLIVRST